MKRRAIVSLLTALLFLNAADLRADEVSTFLVYAAGVRAPGDATYLGYYVGLRRNDPFDSLALLRPEMPQFTDERPVALLFFLPNPFSAKDFQCEVRYYVNYTMRLERTKKLLPVSPQLANLFTVDKSYPPLVSISRSTGSDEAQRRRDRIAIFRQTLYTPMYCIFDDVKTLSDKEITVSVTRSTHPNLSFHLTFRVHKRIPDIVLFYAFDSSTSEYGISPPVYLGHYDGPLGDENPFESLIFLKEGTIPIKEDANQVFILSYLPKELQKDGVECQITSASVKVVPYRMVQPYDQTTPAGGARNSAALQRIDAYRASDRIKRILNHIAIHREKLYVPVYCVIDVNGKGDNEVTLKITKKADPRQVHLEDTFRVRARYRFRVMAGVVYSALTHDKAKNFSVAQNAAGDRFITSSRSVDTPANFPLFLKVYLNPKGADIEDLDLWERLTPIAGINLANSPLGNFYTGLSLEPFNGVDIVFGYHFARVNRLSGFSEGQILPANVSTVPVEQKFERGTFIGVAFDVGIIGNWLTRVMKQLVS